MGFPPQEWQGRLRHFLVPPPENLQATFTVKPFEAQARISGCSPRSALKTMPFFLREGADIDMHLICSGHLCWPSSPRSTEAGWQGQSRTKHPRSIRDRLKWQTLQATRPEKKTFGRSFWTSSTLDDSGNLATFANFVLLGDSISFPYGFWWGDQGQKVYIHIFGREKVVCLLTIALGLRLLAWLSDCY